MDASTRILAAAARLLPDDRREWGAAMRAELAQINDAPSRRRFALGCARASLFSPRRLDSTPGFAITATILSGVAGCVLMTWYVLTRYPMAAQELSRVRLVTFAVLLASYCWIALMPPRAMVPSRRAVRIGAITGLALYVAGSLGILAIDSTVVERHADGIGALFLLLVVVGTFTTCSAMVTTSEGSFRAGVAAALWAGMVCALVGFSVDLLQMTHGVNLSSHIRESIGGGPTPDLEYFLRKHMGGHLDANMRSLAVWPTLAFLFGLIGAAIGSRMGARRARSVVVVQ